MTFGKYVLIALVAMTTPASGEPLKRIKQGYCKHLNWGDGVFECIGLTVDAVWAAEKAEVLERSAEIEKDPRQAEKWRLEAKILRIEAEAKSEAYRLKFAPKVND